MSVSDLHEYVIETTGRARDQEASFPGPLESLAECAHPSGPHFERHFDLLGFADLSTQARSDYRELRPRGGYWNLDMRPRARAASLQQSTRRGLQPHELGPGLLAVALRLHWLCAYAFMLNGAVYIAGLVAGGGWRALLPRKTDLFDALRMFRYYVGFPLAKLARRQWPHPSSNTKYNALQRAAYFTIPIAGVLSVTTGSAIHKHMQFHSLAAIFGRFDPTRVWHFWLMWSSPFSSYLM
jgi:hypothetical protein